MSLEYGEGIRSIRSDPRILPAMKRTIANRFGFLFVAGVVCLFLPAIASAQSKEFKLTPEGAWAKAREAEAGSDEAIIAGARVNISRREYYEARKALDSFIERNESVANPWLPEAYLLRGDTKLGRGKEESALRDYEVIIKDYPASEAFVTALEREHGIGKAYLDGLKRRLFWIRFDNGEPLGEEILIRVCQRLPGSRLAERSLLDLIDYYYRKPDLKFAIEACRIYLGWTSGESGTLSGLAGLTPVSRANKHNEMYVRVRMIQASVLRFAGPRYNAASLEDAKLLIERFSNDYPNEAERTGISDAMASRVDELLAQQMLETARWYSRRGDDVAARYTYRRLVRKHPQTVAGSRARDVLFTKRWGMGEGASLKARERRETDPPSPSPVPTSTNGGAR